MFDRMYLMNAFSAYLDRYMLVCILLVDIAQWGDYNEIILKIATTRFTYPHTHTHTFFFMFLRALLILYILPTKSLSFRVGTDSIKQIFRIFKIVLKKESSNGGKTAASEHP